MNDDLDYLRAAIADAHAAELGEVPIGAKSNT